jgi:integrase/recombinase XerD
MPRVRNRTAKPRTYRFKPGRVKGVVYDHKVDPIAHLPLTHSMEEHFEWLLVTGYTPATVRGRRIAIRRFIAWCDERGLSDAREITRPILERYQRSLFYYRKPDGTPMTLGTQHGFLAPLKTFFKWLTRENHILSNPASELVMPKMPKHLPRALLSVPEIEAILATADPATVPGLRDRAMLETLYSTGMRRTELAGLKRYDADLTRLLVFVHEGKGRKDRVVPLGARAAAWLDKYLIESRPQLLAHEQEALFINDYGEPVSPVWLAIRVRRAMELAGIDKPGSCHLFRHACATHMLDNGADIRFIQAMLGHATLSTTERYTHVAISKLQQIHAATHPARLTRTGKTIEPNADQRRVLLDALAGEDDDGDDAVTDTHAP